MLNNLVAWAVTTGRIYLKSDGTPWRPIVHIEDISRAFIAALEAPVEAVINEAFNVGQTAHNYRIRDIAEIVAERRAGLPARVCDRRRPGHALLSRELREDRTRAARPSSRSGTRARAPSSSMPPTRSSGLTLEEFEGPRYQRIAHIKKLLADGIIDIGLRAGANAPAKPVAEAVA